MRIVIPSLHYADMLAETLPAWCRAAAPSVIAVVTGREDAATQQLAADCGVRGVVTDAWTHDDATLNKALALDVAFGFTPGATPPPDDGEVCIAIDADTYPCDPLPDVSAITDRVLYGVWRHMCDTPDDLEALRAGMKPREAFPRMKNSGGGPVGYFQMFRFVPGMRFGSFPTAGHYDTHFRRRFPTWEMWAHPFLLHLGPSSVKANWSGRVVPQWRAA